MLPGGLTRTKLRDLTHRNLTTLQVDQALADDGKITNQRVLTAGRPAELWTAVVRAKPLPLTREWVASLGPPALAHQHA